MSATDKQYVAIAPDVNTGDLLLIDYRKPEHQTHTVLRKKGESHRVTVDLGNITCPEGWQDALKVSRVFNADISAGRIVGGTEDVVDVTDSENVDISIARPEPRGKYIATIKGGCNSVSLSIMEAVGHGTEVDIDLGNWFDYNSRKTRWTLLSNNGGAELSCRILNSSEPKCIGRWRVYTPWWRPLYMVFYPIWKWIERRLG